MNRREFLAGAVSSITVASSLAYAAGPPVREVLMVDLKHWAFKDWYAGIGTERDGDSFCRSVQKVARAEKLSCMQQGQMFRIVLKHPFDLYYCHNARYYADEVVLRFKGEELVVKSRFRARTFNRDAANRLGIILLHPEVTPSLWR